MSSYNETQGAIHDARMRLGQGSFNNLTDKGAEAIAAAILALAVVINEKDFSGKASGDN